MQQRLGGEDETEVSDALVELVAARSEGNPFYVEELLSFIVSQGVDAGDPAEIEKIRLPDSLHTLVLSRIDAAAEGPRRTMKVASVVGRVFEAKTLPGAYRELGDFKTVLGHLDALRTLDLVALDREADQAWMFKHVVTQEVAYESLPFALRPSFTVSSARTSSASNCWIWTAWCPCSSTTTGGVTARTRSASTFNERQRRPRPHMRTRPRSRTTSVF